MRQLNLGDERWQRPRLAPDVARNHAAGRERLRKLLSYHTPRSIKAVATAMGLSVRTVRSMIDEMIIDGEAVYDFNQGYRSTDVNEVRRG